MADQSNNNGGIVIEQNDTDNLNSGTNSNKLSSKKFFGIVLFGLLLIGGGVYGGYEYIKSHFSFGNDDKETPKNSLNYTSAPDGIGKYTPPPIPDPEPTYTAPTPEESEPAAPTPLQPIIVQNITPEPERDNGPTLQDRRLATGIKSFNQFGTPSGASTEEESSNRRVKLLKNIDYTLIKGTKIPCTMETNIISEQDGFTSCVINQDVYSGNARVLLIEKGTKVTGEYRGSVKNGDRRLQIIWDRLITPYDIVVQLSSPSVGRLGASGITGEVDNRWMLRIGSALLVSIMSDALQIAGDKNKSAEVLVDSKTADTSQQLAKEILRKNIDLNPIIYIREGEMINIYVADDIDLSEAYNAWSIK